MLMQHAMEEARIWDELNCLHSTAFFCIGFSSTLVSSYAVSGEMISCIVVEKLKDLHIQEVMIGSDLCELVEAIKGPNDWSRYCWLLHQVAWLALALPLCFALR
ncbi:hypothetical protein DY000_02062049 [Brassica cretica]|uniref:Uncharacterized protein n=1 Tax=Brassica cretica TaxID=69181 RepID=A0ABQ7ASU6_BRACR|nr:hypothetical protein DY000_02062049 [Brassica cretica]